MSESTAKGRPTEGLTDRFHNGMTVKLQCGGIIEGVCYNVDDDYVLEYAPEGAYERIEWLVKNGRFNLNGTDHPLDIVEVLSEPKTEPKPEPMLSDAELKAVTVKGWELKEG
jgi:hypothetical protein